MRAPVRGSLNKALLLFVFVILVFSLGCAEGPAVPANPKVAPLTKGAPTPSGVEGPTRTPRPSPQPRPTPSPTPTPLPSPTPTPTPIPTETPAPTPTAIPTPSPTPTPFACPASWPSYTNETWRYAIYIPPGWTPTQLNGPDRVEMVSPNADAGILITSTFRTKSLNEWTDEKLAKIALLWGFQMLSKEPFSSGTLTGWKVAYTETRGTFSHAEYRDLFATDGESSFYVTAYAHNNYLVYMPALDIAVSSFQMCTSLPPVSQWGIRPPMPMPMTPVPWWYIATPTATPTATPAK